MAEEEGIPGAITPAHRNILHKPDGASRPESDKPLGQRTPNGRSRESYNAYMKTYMRAYRERSK